MLKFIRSWVFAENVRLSRGFVMANRVFSSSGVLGVLHKPPPSIPKYEEASAIFKLNMLLTKVAS